MTEEKRVELTTYAIKIGLRFGIEEDCVNKKEIDLLFLCQQYMESLSDRYLHSIQTAPHNLEHRSKKFTAEMDKLPWYQHDGELSYLNEMMPQTSQTKLIKEEARSTVENRLTKEGIGKKRILKMLTGLMKVLNNEDGMNPELSDFVIL